MLRADRQSSEERVLLRALRDFNMGKLVADDVSIFVGMIDDLFPKEREHVVRFPSLMCVCAYACNGHRCVQRTYSRLCCKLNMNVCVC
jgi:hypothetical protein